MTSQTISLRDANQQFSRLIAAVERGETFCITRRGREIARLAPLLPSAALASERSSRTEGSAMKPGREAAVITLPEAALGERVRILEARLDKLSSVLTAAEGK